MTENQIEKIIVRALKIHRVLGPGLLEHVYEAQLAYEPQRAGLRVRTQVGLPAAYEEMKLNVGFRADVIVEGKVIVEIKSVDALAKIHAQVLLTYLRLAGLRHGLLINFNGELIKDGIYRLVDGLQDDLETRKPSLTQPEIIC